LDSVTVAEATLAVATEFPWTKLIGPGGGGPLGLGLGDEELGLGLGEEELGLGLGLGDDELGLGLGDEELGLGLGDDELGLGLGLGDDELGLGLGVDPATWNAATTAYQSAADFSVAVPCCAPAAEAVMSSSNADPLDVLDRTVKATPSLLPAVGTPPGDVPVTSAA
jgi:hypothetical protein